MWKLVPTQIYQPLIYKFQNLYSLEYKLECEEKPEEELIDLTSEVTPWKKFEDRHQEVLGSRQCSPATEAQHRGRNNTELSPISRTLQKDLADEIRAQLKQKVSPSRQNYRKIWAIQETEVTP